MPVDEYGDGAGPWPEAGIRSGVQYDLTMARLGYTMDDDERTATVKNVKTFALVVAVIGAVIGALPALFMGFMLSASPVVDFGQVLAWLAVVSVPAAIGLTAISVRRFGATGYGSLAYPIGAAICGIVALLLAAEVFGWLLGGGSIV